jgi:multiple sugar transport system ATP-binding protein
MQGARAGLCVHSLIAKYRSDALALDGVDLVVPHGRTLAIVGPSGAGKSTLLRAICGLHAKVAGDLSIDDRSLARLSPQARRAAMVFAGESLVAQKTVRANLRFVMRKRDDKRIDDLAEVFGLELLLERYPAALSSGERQRVALARALLSDPDVLLLDEPFAALDPDLRVRLRDELLHVRERFTGPIVFVTHDHSDALAVGDDLAVLIDGRIVDSGEPQRVYDRPANMAVARFLGTRPMNIVYDWGNRSVAAGFRPERLRIDARGRFSGTVQRVERTGADAYVHVATSNGTLVSRAHASVAPAHGAQVWLDVDDADVCLFDANSGIALA